MVKAYTGANGCHMCVSVADKGEDWAVKARDGALDRANSDTAPANIAGSSAIILHVHGRELVPVRVRMESTWPNHTPPLSVRVIVNPDSDVIGGLSHYPKLPHTHTHTQNGVLAELQSMKWQLLIHLESHISALS